MLSEFIKKLREKNNFTQEYLAHELNIYRPTYIHIEQGDRDLTIPEAEKLAYIFNMPLENFLHEIEKEISIVVDKKNRVTKSKIKIHIPEENLKKFQQILLYILKK